MQEYPDVVFLQDAPVLVVSLVFTDTLSFVTGCRLLAIEVRKSGRRWARSEHQLGVE